ncbi:MAG TPA: hypothetical protein PLF65_13420 [Desulfobacter postgatei]|uniref:hypothetical protein n=1 Tax=Desulfobacter sp. TaxID=2294 RepID=UPI00257FE2D0|nr:hypothetical protein [Desulfobacter sp.]HRF91793.1 hypothetical protein [Desulfobacter postgatei]
MESKSNTIHHGLIKDFGLSAKSGAQPCLSLVAASPWALPWAIQVQQTILPTCAWKRKDEQEERIRKAEARLLLRRTGEI